MYNEPWETNDENNEIPPSRELALRAIVSLIETFDYTLEQASSGCLDLLSVTILDTVNLPVEDVTTGDAHKLKDIMSHYSEKAKEIYEVTNELILYKAEFGKYPTLEELENDEG
jgi:hypothetical protein